MEGAHHGMVAVLLPPPPPLALQAFSHLHCPESQGGKSRSPPTCLLGGAVPGPSKAAMYRGQQTSWPGGGWAGARCFPVSSCSWETFPQLGRCLRRGRLLVLPAPVLLLARRRPVLVYGNHVVSNRILEPLTQPCKVRLLTQQRKLRLGQDLGLKRWAVFLQSLTLAE